MLNAGGSQYKLSKRRPLRKGTSQEPPDNESTQPSQPRSKYPFPQLFELDELIDGEINQESSPIGPPPPPADSPQSLKTILTELNRQLESLSSKTKTQTTTFQCDRAGFQKALELSSFCLQLAGASLPPAPIQVTHSDIQAMEIESRLLKAMSSIPSHLTSACTVKDDQAKHACTNCKTQLEATNPNTTFSDLSLS